MKMIGEFPTSTVWEIRRVKLALVCNPNLVLGTITQMKSLHFTTMAPSIKSVVLSLSALIFAESLHLKREPHDISICPLGSGAIYRSGPFPAHY